jgi:hypothetical protein
MEPFNVRDAVLCLAFLAGAAVGVVAIVRKQTRAGGLAVAGFALLAVDPLAEFIIFRVLTPSGGDFTVPNWIYVCISSLAAILGVAALSAALWLLIRPATPA